MCVRCTFTIKKFNYYITIGVGAPCYCRICIFGTKITVGVLAIQMIVTRERNGMLTNSICRNGYIIFITSAPTGVRPLHQECDITISISIRSMEYHGHFV